MFPYDYRIYLGVLYIYIACVKKKYNKTFVAYNVT